MPTRESYRLGAFYQAFHNASEMLLSHQRARDTEKRLTFYYNAQLQFPVATRNFAAFFEALMHDFACEKNCRVQEEMVKLLHNQIFVISVIGDWFDDLRPSHYRSLYDAIAKEANLPHGTSSLERALSDTAISLMHRDTSMPSQELFDLILTRNRPTPTRYNIESIYKVAQSANELIRYVPNLISKTFIDFCIAPLNSPYKELSPELRRQITGWYTPECVAAEQQRNDEYNKILERLKNVAVVGLETVHQCLDCGGNALFRKIFTADAGAVDNVSKLNVIRLQLKLSGSSDNSDRIGKILSSLESELRKSANRRFPYLTTSAPASPQAVIEASHPTI